MLQIYLMNLFLQIFRVNHERCLYEFTVASWDALYRPLMINKQYMSMYLHSSLGCIYFYLAEILEERQQNENCPLFVF